MSELLGVDLVSGVVMRSVWPGCGIGRLPLCYDARVGQAQGTEQLVRTMLMAVAVPVTAVEVQLLPTGPTARSEN